MYFKKSKRPLIVAFSLFTIFSSPSIAQDALNSHRQHFPEGGSLAALTAHQVCNLPLSTFIDGNHKQSRGLNQPLEQCGTSVQRLVSLYILANLPWGQVEQVIRNALANPGSTSELDLAIREDPEQASLALTRAAAQNEEFVQQSSSNSAASAANADVVSLTCPVNADECTAPAGSTNALQERNYPNGADFLGEGGEVSFTYNGTQNWSAARLRLAQQQLEDSGYMFVGYHGTSLEAAQSIVFEGVRTRTQDLTPEWVGFYIAGDPAVAYGYAVNSEGRNGVMLRVYAPRSALPNFYLTENSLAAPHAVQNVSRLVGHALPLTQDSITGPEEERGSLETILGWPLAERTVVIPSTIPTDPRNPGGSLNSSDIPEWEKNNSKLPKYNRGDNPPHSEL